MALLIAISPLPFSPLLYPLSFSIAILSTHSPSLSSPCLVPLLPYSPFPLLVSLPSFLVLPFIFFFSFPSHLFVFSSCSFYLLFLTLPSFLVLPLSFLFFSSFLLLHPFCSFPLSLFTLAFPSLPCPFISTLPLLSLLLFPIRFLSFSPLTFPSFPLAFSPTSPSPSSLSSFLLNCPPVGSQKTRRRPLFQMSQSHLSQ